MKQPTTILVLPVFFQNLPVSAILVQILVNTSFPVSSRIFQYLQYYKILVIAKICIADTGRFWKILVIPVLQILEDSGKYWLYQYCRYWKISYEVAECTWVILKKMKTFHFQIII